MTTASKESAIQIVENRFNFSVDKFPLFGPDQIETDIYGLFRSDRTENAFVGRGSVTEDYVPHQTEDVLALTRAAIEAYEVDDMICDAYFNRGHYVRLEASKKHRKTVYGKKDSILPSLFIRAGYGGSAFKLWMGMKRDACRNMMMFHTVEETQVSIHHTSGLRDKMDTLITSFQELKDSWSELVKTVETLKNREVVLNDFLIDIYGEPTEGSQRSATIHKNRTTDLFDRLFDERLKLGKKELKKGEPIDGWEAWNMIQGYHQHHKRHGKLSDYERAIKTAHKCKYVKRAERVLLDLAV